jgi:dTDP-4-dehydrorhamnose 3,5-epimerase
VSHGDHRRRLAERAFCGAQAPVRRLETALSDVVLIQPTIHRDPRGLFMETWREDRFAELGIGTAFVQDNLSRSGRGTLRGLHWQWRRPQAKLIRVVSGAIFDVAVDVRRDSPTFGRWTGAELSYDNGLMMYIPVGFAHGFCVISDQACVEYKCSDYYDPGGEAGLPWDDPVVGVEWPIGAPVLSERDRSHPSLATDRADLL